MQVIRRGFRVIYVPEARSTEQVSLTPRDEAVRRARIIAGRYQAMAYAPAILPWKKPGLVWQVVSHKFFRPLVPFAMIGALLSNLGAVLLPAGNSQASLPRLTFPYNWTFLALQATFYGLAWIGSKFHLKGKLAKFLFLPSFLVNSNLAALVGLYQYLRGQQGPAWQRVTRREEMPE
jgi:hypothetical protein